ncbi:MAG: hypothetical protein KatS3mg077_1613 [Candidatus Binatia bacterium]|nr:MAG: hypothetical protein KatS3mg077_1613 [Candidatus Binatia bacterium]
MECAGSAWASCASANFMTVASRARRAWLAFEGWRAPSVRRFVGSVSVFACLLVAPRVQALELSGVLLYSAGPSGELAGPVWHTASGYGGRPLGFTRWPPPATRGMPFPQASDASLRDKNGQPGLPLWAGAHVTHLFWQFLPGEFPSALVLNLYFNRQVLNPGISVLVLDRYGLTHFVPNPSPYTLAMDLSVATNPATAEFRDGSAVARITAAFFFSSSPSLPELKQWRPADFVNVDRVGTERLEADGLPDGVLIFQLDVSPLPSGGQGANRPEPGALRPLAGIAPRPLQVLESPASGTEPAMTTGVAAQISPLAHSIQLGSTSLPEPSRPTTPTGEPTAQETFSPQQSPTARATASPQFGTGGSTMSVPATGTPPVPPTPPRSGTPVAEPAAATPRTPDSGAPHSRTKDLRSPGAQARFGWKERKQSRKE